MLGLLLLTALSLFAAASVTNRATSLTRAERLLSVCVIWNFIILAPIHVLGVLNVLTASNLALAASSFFALLIVASLLRVPSRREHARLAVLTLTDFVVLPAKAIVECVRARSFATLSLGMAMGIILWTAWLSYLIPSDSWDGLWYHELTIGYAIQQHGYQAISLPTGGGYPANMIQQANGYPRNCEMTSLWFAIFAGRDLVELPNSLAGISMLVSMYLLARRFTPRVAAVGWGGAIVLIPAAFMQMRSTYMDVHVAAFYLMALYFSTARRFTLTHMALALVATSLFIGSKSMALASAPILWLSAAVLGAITFWRTRRKAWLGVLALGTTSVVLMASVCYVRNWVLFKNPLWPIAFDIPALGVHWKGLIHRNTILLEHGTYTLARSYETILKHHPPGHDYADTGAWGYGIGIAFVVVPLGLVALAALLIQTVRTMISGVRRRGWDGDTLNAALVAGIVIGTASAMTTLWYPRYNLYLAAGFMLWVAWLGREHGRLAEGCIGAMLASAVSFIYWQSPGWGATWKGALERAEWSREVRAMNASTDFTIRPDVAKLRDQELGPGTVVAFSGDQVFVFVAQLWNDRYTNRLVWVPPTSLDAFVKGVDAAGATWVVLGISHPFVSAFNERKTEWEYVGLAARTEKAFRRIKPAPAPTR